MPTPKPEIDINRRNFIKLSLVLTGAVLLDKISGVLSLASRIAPDPASRPSKGSSSAVFAPARRTPFVGTKEYRNARYGFSLLYPSDLAVSTFDEGSGAATITFQNIHLGVKPPSDKARGFQIFITPHSEPQAGERRFKQDVPSGVRKSLRNIAVGGIKGDAFYSENAALGATREVWFVRDGFLYEVTTHQSLDRWLGAILQTWKFV